MTEEAVTLVRNAIHNPAEPRHFMRIKPVAKQVVIRHGEEILVETTQAVRLLEAGRDLYDPVLYVPEADVTARLKRNEETSHCPLKGDAVYFDLLCNGGAVRKAKIAWSYPEPLGFAQGLAGLIAFYSDAVTIEEGPLPQAQS